MSDEKSVPLEGGTLSLPLEGLSRLVRLATVEYDGSPVVAVVRAPGNVEIQGEWERTSLGHAFENGAHVFTHEIHTGNADLFHRLGVALKNAAPPAGTSFELESRDPQTGVARQRYAGSIEGETLVLTSSSPALSSSLLNQALELFRQGDEGVALRMASAEIASSVFKVAQDSLDFLKGQFDREGDDTIIWTGEANESMWMSKLAGYAVLRTPAFADAWDLHEALSQQDADLLQAATAHQAMTAQVSAIRAGARGPQRDVVHEGRWSKFLTAELTEHAHVTEQDQSDIEALLAELGFEPAGGLTCMEWHGALASGYTSAQRDIFGLVRADLHGRFTLDFRSTLGDGAHLVTTSRADDAEDLPDIANLGWLRYASHPLATPEELLDHHRQTLTSAGPAQPVTGLESVASAIDALMTRMMKL